MERKHYTDDQIAIALRATGGSIIRAATWLGCHVLTVRNRVNRSKELKRLHVPGRSGRPLDHLRVVSDEQIVAALDRSDSVKAASVMLGMQRQTIASRAYAPEIEAALTRCEQRHRAVVLERAQARLAERRAAIAEKMAREEEHAILFRELQLTWQQARDTWIANASVRGLSLNDMGRILGVSRERVRQLEEDLGMGSRRARRRRAA